VPPSSIFPQFNTLGLSSGFNKEFKNASQVLTYMGQEGGNTKLTLRKNNTNVKKTTTKGWA
jgi:hypothetical protein